MENVGLNCVLILLIFSSIFDIALSSVSCTFDSGLCGWNSTTSGQFKWRRGSGQTADRLSGPLNDHTCANSNGQYIYISGSKSKPNDIAVIETEHVTITNGTVLTFWYIMNGYATGNLTLNAIADDQRATTLWQKFGPQGKYWNKGSVALTPGLMKLQFQSTVRLPSGSDIAIDDITLSSESQDLNKTHCFKSTTSTTTTTTTTTTTPTTRKRVTTRRPHTQQTTLTPGTCLIDTTEGVLLPGTCDFENDTCGIQVVADKDKAFVTWMRTNRTDGSFKDKEHAIVSDHTLGNTSDTGGYYMDFVDGGSHWVWEKASNIAQMETPTINSSHICLSFWYSMPKRYSNLKLYIKDGYGDLTKIFDLNIIKETEIKTGWHLFTMDINEESPFTIIFESVNQYHLNRVGIDDIQLLGYNKQSTGSGTPPGTSTTSEPSSSSSTNMSMSTSPSSDRSTFSVAALSSTVTLPPNTTDVHVTSTTQVAETSTTQVAETTSNGVPVHVSSTNIISTTADKGSGKKTTVAATKKPGKQELGETDALRTENKYRRTSKIIGACVGSLIGFAFVSVIIYMLILQVRDYRNSDKQATDDEHIHQTDDLEDTQYHKNGTEKRNGYSHPGIDNHGYCMIHTVCDTDQTPCSKSKSDTITHF